MSSKHKKSLSSQLWTKSPCSYNYSQPSAFIQLEQRFSYGSIYFPLTEKHPQKKILNCETNLLQKFRASLHEIQSSKRHKAAFKHKKLKPKFQTRVIKQKQNNLYEIPPKNAFRFDRYGNRSYEIGDFDVQEIRNNLIGDKNRKGFSFGRRLDFSRPLNFVPGPGTYQNLSVPFTKTSFNKSSIQKIQSQLTILIAPQQQKNSLQIIEPSNKLMQSISKSKITSMIDSKKKNGFKLKKISLEQLSNISYPNFQKISSREQTLSQCSNNIQ